MGARSKKAKLDVGGGLTAPTPSGPSPSSFRVKAAAVICAVFVVHYFFIVGFLGVPAFTKTNPETYYENFHFDEIRAGVSDHYGFYNLLADGFASGHLDLSIKPDERFKSLANPLDPAQNGAFRMHDVSYFKGKYYLYFGPTPALVLFLPIRLLGLGKLTEPYAAAMLASGCLILSILMLFKLIQLLRLNPNPFVFVSQVVFLGACGLTSFTLCRPVMYEVAILTGALFSLATIYFILKGMDASRRSTLYFALAGLSLGLAVGCRPNLVVLACPVFLMLLFIVIRNIGSVNRRLLLLGLNAGGFGVCLLGLFVYNYLRFGSPFEFGNSFQLVGAIEPPQHLSLKNLSYLIPNLWNYFGNPPSFKSYFPFAFPQNGWAPDSLQGSYLVNEPITGMLWSCPGLVALCGAFGLCFSQHRNRLCGQSSWLFVLACGGVCLSFSAILLHSTTQRYLLDFALPLQIAASIAAMVFFEASETWIKSLGVASLVHGFLLLPIYWFFGFSGYYDLPKTSNPERFLEWERIFSPVSAIMTRLSNGPDATVLEVMSPTGRATASDGRAAFLFGPKPAYVRVSAKKRGSLRMRTEIVPASGSGEYQVRCGEWDSGPLPLRAGVRDFTVPLSIGMNRLEVSLRGGATSSEKGSVVGALVAPSFQFDVIR